MTELVDSEKCELPKSEEDGRPLFRTEFVVMSGGAEVWVHVPRYLQGYDMDCKHFEYDSCGLLSAKFVDVVDYYIENYKYSCSDMSEAESLRDTFLETTYKLNKWIEAEKTKDVAKLKEEENHG